MVFQFTAHDEDAGNNRLLSYSIAFGNTANTFAVNEKLGKLTNVGQIDREMVSHFTLQVVAEDGIQSFLSAREVIGKVNQFLN